MSTERINPAESFTERTDVLIIGSGAAGLTAALTIAEADPTRSVALIARGVPADSCTAWALGRLASVISPGDSFDLHIEDTMAAGDFHGDRARVTELVHAAKEAIDRLVSHGAQFADDLHLEGGHSLRRIVHAGDQSGWEVEKTLLCAARDRGINIISHARAIDLLTTADGTVCGVRGFHNGHVGRWLADDVVLAAGGIGALWTLTSNPAVATADGLAMALRAGAAPRAIAFLQLHPTGLAFPRAVGRALLSYGVSS